MCRCACYLEDLAGMTGKFQHHGLFNFGNPDSPDENLILEGLFSATYHVSIYNVYKEIHFSSRPG